jgi:hypothetical protein
VTLSPGDGFAGDKVNPEMAVMPACRLIADRNRAAVINVKIRKYFLPLNIFPDLSSIIYIRRARVPRKIPSPIGIYKNAFVISIT